MLPHSVNVRVKLPRYSTLIQYGGGPWCIRFPEAYKKEFVEHIYIKKYQIFCSRYQFLDSGTG